MRKVFSIGAVIIFVIALFAFYFLEKNNSADFEITFLDVGQGDSALIEAPGGQNILIDGGPDKRVIRELAKALPFWERKIDLIVLTHSHADHVTGLTGVLERFQAGRVFYNGLEPETPVYEKFLKLARSRAELWAVKDRQKIKIGPDCEMELIYPGDWSGEEDNLNNASLVSRLDCLGQTALFAGDIEKEAEEKLLAEDYSLESRVLKVSHHGSDTSSQKKFLQKADPEIAVIQAGRDNRKGHPSRRVLKKLERIGAHIFWTDLSGTIELSFKPNQTEVEFLSGRN